MFDTLKRETSAIHAQVEKILVSQLKSINTHADYAKLISIFYGYYSGLEQKLDQFIDTDLLPDYPIRRKARALRDDLQQLKYTETARQSPIPAIRSISEAVGCLYVIEGSTLGGQVIVAMLKRALPGADNCFTFFNSYGDRTHLMWQRFKDQIAASETKLSTPEVLAGAQKTFEGLQQWLNNNNN